MGERATIGAVFAAVWAIIGYTITDGWLVQTGLIAAFAWATHAAAAAMTSSARS